MERYTFLTWGQKAFTAYLGADSSAWAEWDACTLLGKAEKKLPLLIDQGDADEFLVSQLQPERLTEACRISGHALTLRMQPGYDHSYYFIATFIAEHIAWHAHALHL
jgi:S-formylglutathione hydrolase